MSVLGILGAGRVGMALARLARNADLEVLIAGSGDPASLADGIAAESPGAVAVTAEEAARSAYIVILAIPLGKYRTLPATALAGKLVIDAMNYWWELDGVRPEFSDPQTSTSETLQKFLVDSRLAKTFNHASVWELENLARPAGHPERRALAVAADQQEDMAQASHLVDAMGFDPVPAGPLANGVMLEPGAEAFGADASAAEMRTMLNRFWTSQRGLVVARNRDMPPAGC
ncbi:NADPH-dependent F420 reductase [Demequina lutea]|uniref:Pyrroline-5-carboxylate reductase catalytic N-terminal domain-containing protein n=1 Tax=Demequina lutea TaxID=431489 RepID=A0A7Z0CGU6_9MICO|nr:NAD(P)-binding domain-containing protein [Demequina lutea]NYI40816.1 hypothetical protein [Demequina lutea]